MRIGLVGLRGINSWMYRPAIRNHPRAELVAGCDPDPGAAERFRSEQQLPVFATIAEMAQSAKLDGIMIGTPNPIHLRNIAEAAACGVAMCVTKPLTNTVEEGRKAIAVCQKAGVLLAVGHEYRFRPEIRELRKRVAAGELGKVTLAQAHMGHQGGISNLTAPNTWRSSQANAPGGCHNLLGIHCIDLLNALLGQPCSVSATLKRLLSSSELEDTAATVVEYRSGAVGIATSSYASSPSNWLRVYGSEANMLADTRAGKLFIEKDKQLTEIAVAPGPDSGHAVVDMFVRAVEDGVPPESGGPEGLLAVMVLEASLASQQRGARIPVAPMA